MHMEDVGGAMLDELSAVAEEGTEGTHLGVGAEGGVEEAEGVELADPLAVGEVGLASGDVLDVGSVDQVDLEAAPFQEFEDGNPIDAGGLHRHGVHAAILEPVGESCRSGVKVAKRRTVSPGRSGRTAAQISREPMSRPAALGWMTVIDARDLLVMITSTR